MKHADVRPRHGELLDLLRDVPAVPEQRRDVGAPLPVDLRREEVELGLDVLGEDVWELVQLAEADVRLPGAVGRVELHLLVLRWRGPVPQSRPARARRDALLAERRRQPLPAELGGLPVLVQGRRVDLKAVAEDRRERVLPGLRGLRGVAEGGQQLRAGLRGVPPRGPARHHLEGLQGGHALQHVEDRELAEERRAPHVDAGGPHGPAHARQGRVGGLCSVYGLPAEQLEEGDPDDQVPQGVELRLHQPPVCEGVREHERPHAPPVDVLQG